MTYRRKTKSGRVTLAMVTHSPLYSTHRAKFAYSRLRNAHTAHSGKSPLIERHVYRIP